MVRPTGSALLLVSHSVPLAAPDAVCDCLHEYRDHAQDGAAHACTVAGCPCAAYVDEQDA
jgi:hypothetical protein